jgi:hypothetical protein
MNASGNTIMRQNTMPRQLNTRMTPYWKVFARLNSLRENKDGKENTIKQNIDELVKMARPISILIIAG